MYVSLRFALGVILTFCRCAVPYVRMWSSNDAHESPPAPSQSPSIFAQHDLSLRLQSLPEAQPEPPSMQRARWYGSGKSTVMDQGPPTPTDSSSSDDSDGGFAHTRRTGDPLTTFLTEQRELGVLSHSRSRSTRRSSSCSSERSPIYSGGSSPIYPLPHHGHGYFAPEIAQETPLGPPQEPSVQGYRPLSPRWTEGPFVTPVPSGSSPTLIDPPVVITVEKIKQNAASTAERLVPVDPPRRTLWDRIRFRKKKDPAMHPGESHPVFERLVFSYVSSKLARYGPAEA